MWQHHDAVADLHISNRDGQKGVDTFLKPFLTPFVRLSDIDL